MVVTGRRPGREESRFGGIDLGMIARIVAVPPVEGDRPDDSDPAENEERGSPIHLLEEGEKEQRRDCPAPPCREPEDSLRLGAFGGGEPALERLGDVGEAARLPGAE